MRRAMNRRRVMAGLAAGTLAMLLGACGESNSWHQKLTVEVETPDGLVSGSSVVSVTSTFNDSKLMPHEARGGGAYVKGEAVVVEVARGKYLFALLNGETHNGLPDQIAWQTFADGEPPQLVSRRLARIREQRDVAPRNYPLLVTFDDVDDPKSVRKVDPADLAAAFGRGVRLKRITIAITDEPVTKGKVEKVLGWLSGLRGSIGKNLDLPYSHFLNKITDGSFRQGVGR